MQIVLLQPEIPENTGNIARLAAATKSTLHLIRPLGFRLDDKRMKRAGLDYWETVDLHIHVSWEEFVKTNPGTYWFFSTKAKRLYTDVQYGASDFLCFGSETAGLPTPFYETYRNQLLRIPITDAVRSLNLANSVAIALYESLRQQTVDTIGLIR